MLRDVMRAHAAKIVVVVGFASAVWLAYAYLPLVRVANSKVSLRDVRDFVTLTGKLAAITGLKDSPGYRLALQTLVLSGLEREVLAKKQVTINRDAALTLLVSDSPFRGLLEEARADMGDERFYRVFIEPRAVGDAFQLYYNNNDPQRLLATGALDAARTGGLAAAEAKAAIKPAPVTLQLTEATAGLFAAARQVGVNRLIPAVIEDATSFSLLYLRELGERSLVGDAIIVRRTAAGRFVRDEAAKAGVGVAFPFYSPFSMATLEKPGMIFSKAALGEEPTNEKK